MSTQSISDMNESYQQYQGNVKAGVHRLKASVALFLARHDLDSTNDVKENLKAVGLLFGDISRAPVPIQMLYSNFNKYLSDESHAGLCYKLLESFSGLNPDTLFDAAGGFNSALSFDVIFDAYKTAGDLNTLIGEFTGLIQRVLDEEDETLTQQVARELGIILEKLKNRDKKSLYEVQTWIDLGIRALLLYAETQTEGHGFTLAWEGVKTGVRTVKKIVSYYDESQGKLASANGLKFVQRAVVKYPQLPSEEEAERILALPQGGERPPHEGGE